MSTKDKIVITLVGKLAPEIKVPGQPVPSSLRRGRGRMYLGKRTQEYRDRIVDAATDKLGPRFKFIRGAIGILTRFTRKGKTKADVDNVQKSVQDALTGVLWADDNAVEAIVVLKNYGKIPMTKIQAMALDNVNVRFTHGKT